MTAHPSVAVTNPDAQAAVDAFVAGLQAGHDRVTTPPTADPDRPFSEMAMYVLVRRGDQWWLAAGQNTPMRPGGAVPATA